MRLGITLIFYIQNPAEYLLEEQKNHFSGAVPPVTLTALASEGKKLLPIEIDKEEVKAEKELSINRNHLIAAARNGDEEAIENLTLEEMDTYSMISERIVTDDILTIVDTSFMPYGIECDQYGILGEIRNVISFKNILTGEELCQLTVESNDIELDICINKNDLLGEPMIGRRFKGNVWLQGRLLF